MASMSEYGKNYIEEPLGNNQKAIKIQKIEVDIKPAKTQPNSIDVQWINQQLMHDEVIVKNYLDCGLDNFSLQIN